MLLVPLSKYDLENSVWFLFWFKRSWATIMRHRLYTQFTGTFTYRIASLNIWRAFLRHRSSSASTTLWTPSPTTTNINWDIFLLKEYCTRIRHYVSIKRHICDTFSSWVTVPAHAWKVHDSRSGTWFVCMRAGSVTSSYLQSGKALDMHCMYC